MGGTRSGRSARRSAKRKSTAKSSNDIDPDPDKTESSSIKDGNKSRNSKEEYTSEDDDVIPWMVSAISKFKFPEYDKSKEPWKYYIQRFELNTTLQSLTDAQVRRNLLLNVIGAESYRIILDHFDPEPILEVYYDYIRKFLDGYYKPTTGVLSERIRFGKLVRQPSHTVTQFLNELRAIATLCKFGRALDEGLRDQFLIGLQNHPMVEEILKQCPDENSTLAEIEERALNYYRVSSAAKKIFRVF